MTHKDIVATLDVGEDDEEDYDTWEVDELQLLVYKNREFFLFPNWSNSSEYVTTEESFDVVALQSKDDQDTLKERCQELEKEGPLPKLTRELQFQCNAIGTPIPFLPFSYDTERIKFSTYMQDFSPMKTIDDKKAAVHWNRHFVNGINIWPKLPVHLHIFVNGREVNDRKIYSRVIKAAETNWQNSIRSSPLLPLVLLKIIPI